MVFKKKKVEAKKTEHEKLEERREEVLAQGRKFKYPLQYAKHRVVFITIIVIMAVLAALVVGGWLALYKFNSANDTLYKITQFLPVSVAKVDGESVKFSDYLMVYKSSLNAVEQQAEYQNNGTDLEMMKEEYRRTALTQAEDYAYALKLGKELGIEVSDGQVMAMFENHRKAGGTLRSEESFLKILQDNFGMTKTEYKRMLYLSIVKAEVEQKIDEEANAVAEKVEQMLAANGGNYEKVATDMAGDVIYDSTDGLVDSKNIDGGRATMAMTLEKGAQSGRFVSSNGDGYYFIKVLDKTDTQVSYVSIKVPFTEFDSKLAKIRTDGLVDEFITFREKEE